MIQHQILSIGPGQGPPPRRPEASGSILRPGDDATAIGGKGDGAHSLAVAPQSPRGAGIPAPTGGPLRLCRPSRSAFPQTHARGVVLGGGGQQIPLAADGEAVDGPPMTDQPRWLTTRALASRPPRNR